MLRLLTLTQTYLNKIINGICTLSNQIKNFLITLSYSLWEQELEVLVGGKESNELWHLDGLESSGLVYIEMSPSLGEVGGEISIEVSSADFLVGAEDFLSAGHSFLLSDGNDSGNSGLLGLFLLLLGFFLDVVLED